jgi:hypothetical protein
MSMGRITPKDLHPNKSPAYRSFLGKFLQSVKGKFCLVVQQLKRFPLVSSAFYFSVYCGHYALRHARDNSAGQGSLAIQFYPYYTSKCLLAAPQTSLSNTVLRSRIIFLSIDTEPHYDPILKPEPERHNMMRLGNTGSTLVKQLNSGLTNRKNQNPNPIGNGYPKLQ